MSSPESADEIQIVEYRINGVHYVNQILSSNPNGEIPPVENGQNDEQQNGDNFNGLANGDAHAQAGGAAGENPPVNEAGNENAVQNGGAQILPLLFGQNDLVAEVGQNVLDALAQIRDLMRDFDLPRRANSVSVQRDIVEGQYAAMRRNYEPMNVQSRNNIADRQIELDNQSVRDAKPILLQLMVSTIRENLPANQQFVGEGLSALLEVILDIVYPTPDLIR